MDCHWTGRSQARPREKHDSSISTREQPTPDSPSGAEERRREAPLRGGIIRIEALARGRKFDEVLRLLERLASDNPDSPDLASCRENIRRRAWADCWPRTEQGKMRSAGGLALSTLGARC